MLFFCGCHSVHNDWFNDTTKISGPTKATHAKSKKGMQHPNCGSLYSAKFSHGSKLLVTAGWEGQICLWNTADWSLAKVIDQPGDISCLEFSPDDKYLYVGDDDEEQKVLARFDIKTGKIDKRYQGHKGGVYWMALTPDGKTMVTASYHDDKAIVWDTKSGKIKNRINLEPNKYYAGPNIFLSKNGTILSLDDGLHSMTLDGTKVKPVPYPKEIHNLQSSRNLNACLSEDKSILCTYSENDSTKWVKTVKIYDVDKEFQLIGQIPLPDFKELEPLNKEMTAIAVSKKANRIAIGGSGWLRLLSLSKLKVMATFIYPNYACTRAVQSLDFSPNGLWLAMTNSRDTPFIFKSKNLKELYPYSGHAEYLRIVAFAENGKRLFSVGGDEKICYWDTNTMKMLKRKEFPEGYQYLSMRPWDGKYIICENIKTAVESKVGEKGTIPVRVLNTNSGKVICQFTLPLGFYRNNIFWVNNEDILVYLDDILYRYNYLTGKLLSKVKIKDYVFSWGAKKVMEDGKRFFVYPAPGKGQGYVDKVSVVDIATGKISTRKMPKIYRCRKGGLVPGGKYFYLAAPDVFIFNRHSLVEKNKVILGEKIEIEDIAFCPNGEFYAILTKDIEAEFVSPKTIKVFATFDSKPVLTFRPSDFARTIKWSTVKKQLAIRNNDSTIEVLTFKNLNENPCVLPQKNPKKSDYGNQLPVTKPVKNKDEAFNQPRIPINQSIFSLDKAKKKNE